MDGATSEDVTRAITTFGNKHRIPAKIVVDSGPQLKALSNNPIFDATTAMGVPVETVAPNHQFLNFSERQIQVFKGLMTTMKKNKDKSIYDQDETILDLQEKLSMVYKVMSLRPILVKHSDEDETIIIAAQLIQPTLTHANVEEYMIQMLVGKGSVQHQLYASIIGYKDGILAAFYNQMLQYLQENSVYY